MIWNDYHHACLLRTKNMWATTGGGSGGIYGDCLRCRAIIVTAHRLLSRRRFLSRMIIKRCVRPGTEKKNSGDENSTHMEDQITFPLSFLTQGHLHKSKHPRSLTLFPGSSKSIEEHRRSSGIFAHRWNLGHFHFFFEKPAVDVQR